MERRKKYLTEEERLEARRAYNRKWKAEHKEKIAEYNAKYNQTHKCKIAEIHSKWYQKHKEEIAERNAKYYQDHKDVKAEYWAKYYQEHKDELNEYMVKYREEHKDKFAKYNAKYLNTMEGRAINLIGAYKQKDTASGRGDCNLTVPWFIENIFNQRCYYCGESDWKKLGVDRIDNSKPHTIENVVPSCMSCNRKRQKKPFEQFCREMNAPTTVNFS